MNPVSSATVRMDACRGPGGQGSSAHVSEVDRRVLRPQLPSLLESAVRVPSVSTQYLSLPSRVSSCTLPLLSMSVARRRFPRRTSREPDRCRARPLPAASASARASHPLRRALGPDAVGEMSNPVEQHFVEPVTQRDPPQILAAVTDPQGGCRHPARRDEACSVAGPRRPRSTSWRTRAGGLLGRRQGMAGFSAMS